MSDDPYADLRPAAPAPEDELCACGDETPLKLMSMRQVRGFNPIHCLDCNLEVPPERLALHEDLVQAIVEWDEENGAINTLELASGEYEDWAVAQLLDPESATNVDGRELARELSEVRPAYVWFFQANETEGWEPPDACPVCGGELELYEGGAFPQLLCETDRIVLAGGPA